MPVFTFSTKERKPSDEALIRRVKKICADEGLNFSAIVIAQLRKWEQERSNDGE